MATKPNLLARITNKPHLNPDDFVTAGAMPNTQATKSPTTPEAPAKEKATYRLSSQCIKTLLRVSGERGGRRKGWPMDKIVEEALMDWFAKENIDVVE